MIVFDLQCDHDHTFEGWFGSSADFDSQVERGLLECPFCTSKTIGKKLSAPRLNFGAQPAPSVPAPAANPSPSSDVATAMPTPAQVQAMWLKMAREVVKNTEDVGDKFAEEARKIHYKEAPERGIRGKATREQAQELADEGIDVMALPLPAAARDSLQ